MKTCSKMTDAFHNQFHIIATINHKQIDAALIEDFIRNGVTIFRINTSFVQLDKLPEVIGKIKSHIDGNAKILLDLPGAKIRFSYLNEDLRVNAGVPFKVESAWFNHPEFIKEIHVGSTLRILDGMVILDVVDINEDSIILVSNDDTLIRRGKGLHVGDSSFTRPFKTFSELDDKIIETAVACDVDFLGLSFVADANDINYVKKKLIGTRIQCIPKIETKKAIDNLHEILEISDLLIIDRGDLAGEIGLDNVWKSQRQIIELAHLMGTEVILATQFLTSMIAKPLPSIAEIDSLYSLLDCGANGIQLSDETCIGQYASQTIKILKRSVEQFNGNGHLKSNNGNRVFWIMGPTASGKTTLAKSLCEKFYNTNLNPVFIDGDEIRELLGKTLGFSNGDRSLVIKNLVHHTNKHAINGSPVIVAALTANEADRKYIQKSINNLVFIYLKCSIDECIKRDPKGLYNKALSGEIDTLIGINQPYTAPKPNTVGVTIDTEELSIEESSEAILKYAISNNLLSV